LLDSLQKRLTFLETVCRELSLPVELVHARAEEGGRRPALREQYDVAVARAVAALPTLCEYCLPFVKVGGRFVALKGPDIDREQEAAAKAVTLLGGKVTAVERLTLPVHHEPDSEPMERRLLRIDKIRPTPAAYPRPSAKISKQPL
jgi:16S rRNA (guanine527-N7)-methyltransferase